MKYFLLPLFFISLMLLCACTMFDTRQPSPDPIVIPVGKNWQIIEEAPKLSNDQGRLPFQMEQSVEPEGAKPAAPTDNRTIKTPL